MQARQGRERRDLRQGESTTPGRSVRAAVPVEHWTKRHARRPRDIGQEAHESAQIRANNRVFA